MKALWQRPLTPGENWLNDFLRLRGRLRVEFLLVPIILVWVPRSRDSMGVEVGLQGKLYKKPFYFHLILLQPIPSSQGRFIFTCQEPP